MTRGSAAPSSELLPGGAAAIAGAVAAGQARPWRKDAGGARDRMMSQKEEIRLRAKLRAASVLLAALMRETDADGLRHVFESAVVRETAHMLERGARSEAIRAFEDAAGEWAVRSRLSLRPDRRREPRHEGRTGAGRSRRERH